MTCSLRCLPGRAFDCDYMVAGRVLERLAALDHASLLSYAAEMSAVDWRHADVFLAAYKPLPAWARDGVMLSADLLPSVLTWLPFSERDMGLVCHAWKDAWIATFHVLRPKALPTPDFALDSALMHHMHQVSVVELPGNRLFAWSPMFHCIQPDALARRGEGEAMVVDANMKLIRCVHDMMDATSVVASDDALYVSFKRPCRLCRYELDEFTMTKMSILDESLMQASVEEDDLDEDVYMGGHIDELLFLTLAPDAPRGGLFACAVSEEMSSLAGKHWSVLCFDTSDLEIVAQFGRDHLGPSCVMGPCGMGVCGAELFVSGGRNSGFDVFSLSGEHLRSVHLRSTLGNEQLLCFDGLLYIKRWAGDIDVVTPEGEFLFSYRRPQRRIKIGPWSWSSGCPHGNHHRTAGCDRFVGTFGRMLLYAEDDEADEPDDVLRSLRLRAAQIG